MSEVVVSREFEVPAERVWAVLADFGDINWAPGMEKVEVIGEGPGMTRRIFMPDMEPIDEVLQSIDHEQRSLRYTIPRGNPLPIKDYLAGPTVVALNASHCRVDWLGQFSAAGISDAEAEDAVRGIYGMMLQWLDEHICQEG